MSVPQITFVSESSLGHTAYPLVSTCLLIWEGQGAQEAPEVGDERKEDHFGYMANRAGLLLPTLHLCQPSGFPDPKEADLGALFGLRCSPDPLLAGSAGPHPTYPRSSPPWRISQVGRTNPTGHTALPKSLQHLSLESGRAQGPVKARRLGRVALKAWASVPWAVASLGALGLSGLPTGGAVSLGVPGNPAQTFQLLRN